MTLERNLMSHPFCIAITTRHVAVRLKTQLLTPTEARAVAKEILRAADLLDPPDTVKVEVPPGKTVEVYAGLPGSEQIRHVATFTNDDS